MAAQIQFKYLPTQGEMFNDDTTGTMVYSGGLGSGKTYTLVMKALKLSCQNKGFAGGFLCPSYADFKKDVYPTFVEILEKFKVKYRYHQQDKTFHFPWTKAPLYIFTGEKPIAGPNLAYCLINEYSLINFTRVNEMLRRVRSKHAPNKQRCLAGTPEDIHGWLEEFIDAQKDKGDFKIMFADTSENIHIDDDYRKYLASMLDEQSLKVFAGGQIGRIGGEYFYYSFDKIKTEDKLIVRRPNELIHVGMDFNVGQMTASFSHKVWINQRLEQHFFDTILLKFESANTYDLCDSIVKRYCNSPGLLEKASQVSQPYFRDQWKSLPLDIRQLALSNMLITCDASGKNRSTSSPKDIMSDVLVLRSYGFTVRYKRANTRLRKRQLLLNGLLFHGRIKANPDTCKPLLNDWKNVRQKQENYEKVKDKDNKLTHFSDGADYVIDYEYKLPTEMNRKKIGVM